MSGEYFGRLIATGEWGVCLLYLAVKYVTLKKKEVKIFKYLIYDVL